MCEPFFSFINLKFKFSENHYKKNVLSKKKIIISNEINPKYIFKSNCFCSQFCMTNVTLRSKQSTRIDNYTLMINKGCHMCQQVMEIWTKILPEIKRRDPCSVPPLRVYSLRVSCRLISCCVLCFTYISQISLICCAECMTGWPILDH